MILPYNSGDSSVVLECALTDSADITSNGGTERTGATVDSNGIKGATAGCCVFDIGSYDTRLDSAGQISFETQAKYLTATEGTGNPSPHGGHDHYGDATADAVHFGANTADNNTGSFMLLNTYSSDNRHGYKLQHGAEGDYFNTGKSICYANGEYCRVTLAWDGAKRECYFNGVKVFSSTTAGFTVGGGELRYLSIGSVPGSVWPVLSGQYYKNLTVSYKPVSFSSHPLLSDVVFVGDSFIAQSQTDTLSLKAEPWRSSVQFAVEKHLADYGLRANIYIDDAVSGETIYASATPISGQLAGALAKKPRIVCYRGGTNDAIAMNVGVTTSQIQTGLETDLTTLLDSDTVEYVILGTVPSLRNGDGLSSPDYQSTAYDGYVDSVNTVINAMPAWAASNGYTGRVIVVDQFTDFGGHSLNTELFQTSNIHPGSFGKWAQGITYAKGIMQVLS